MKPWSRDEFTEQLRAIGQARYHDKHPFHRLMNDGRLSRDQLQLWVANRFYYQKNIPIKDAILLSRCPDRAIRKKWIQRIHDHDGMDGAPGGIDKWLRLAAATGVAPEELEDDRRLLPGGALRRRRLREVRGDASVGGRGRLVADRAVLAQPDGDAAGGVREALHVDRPRGARVFPLATHAGAAGTPITGWGSSWTTAWLVRSRSGRRRRCASSAICSGRSSTPYIISA